MPTVVDAILNEIRAEVERQDKAAGGPHADDARHADQWARPVLAALGSAFGTRSYGKGRPLYLQALGVLVRVVRYHDRKAAAFREQAQKTQGPVGG